MPEPEEQAQGNDPPVPPHIVAPSIQFPRTILAIGVFLVLLPVPIVAAGLAVPKIILGIILALGATTFLYGFLGAAGIVATKSIKLGGSAAVFVGIIAFASLYKNPDCPWGGCKVDPAYFALRIEQAQEVEEAGDLMECIDVLQNNRLAQRVHILQRPLGDDQGTATANEADAELTYFLIKRDGDFSLTMRAKSDPTCQQKFWQTGELQSRQVVSILGDRTNFSSITTSNKKPILADSHQVVFVRVILGSGAN